MDHQMDHQTNSQCDSEAVIAAYSDDALLHALAAFEFSPLTLAETLNVSPFVLLAWLESDEVQSKLDRYHNLERQLLELRSFQSRRRTIQSLEHVLQTTEDLIEVRRTATTLHRVISGAQRRTKAEPFSHTPGRTTPGGTDLRDVTRSTSPSLQDERAERGSASDHGTPEPHPPSTSHETPTPTFHSEPPPAEPGSASDHGTPEPRTLPEPPASPAPTSEHETRYTTDPVSPIAPLTLPSREAAPFDSEETMKAGSPDTGSLSQSLNRRPSDEDCEP
jgi:hypothetical protein